MADVIDFPGPVTVVGGGAIKRADFDAALAFAPHVVAADGGANVLRDWGVSAEAVIGDMDSVEQIELHRAGGARICHLSEQDTTDFEKCLYATRAPFYLGVGFTGRRFDHTLAALHALMRQTDSRSALIAEEEVIFLAPRLWRARLAPGARVSIAPLRPVRALSSVGLEYPLEQLDLSLGERIGTSNRASEETVEVAFDRAGAAIMIEKQYLAAVVDSVLRGVEER